jgi:hypothetical protein
LDKKNRDSNIDTKTANEERIRAAVDEAMILFDKEADDRRAE